MPSINWLMSANCQINQLIDGWISYRWIFVQIKYFETRFSLFFMEQIDFSYVMEPILIFNFSNFLFYEIDPNSASKWPNLISMDFFQIQLYPITDWFWVKSINWLINSTCKKSIALIGETVLLSMDRTLVIIVLLFLLILKN